MHSDAENRARERGRWPTKESSMAQKKRTLTILPVSTITITIIMLLYLFFRPGLSSPYRFSSVKEARASTYREDAEIIDEIGDTNGPYRFMGGMVSGVRNPDEPFEFDLKCWGQSIKWSQPKSNQTFSVYLFGNRKGNQFAVIRRRPYNEK